jgi:glycerol-3-phosphate dehydrogenase (NAD(P)+)
MPEVAESIAVIGGGSWGTALAVLFARSRPGAVIPLWVYEPDLAQAMAETRTNKIFLPGIALPPEIRPSADLRACRAPVLVMATPSHALRPTLARMASDLPPEAVLVLATKGLEANSLLRASEVVESVLGANASSRLATLSGPTFAREIALGEPAAVVIASRDVGLGRVLQRQLATPTLRLYTTSDVVGVELAASLKNVIAIASGICQGLGLGSNTRAALIARGLAEITRLVVAAGGQADTVAGLAGLGDLVLTCTGELSRNRALGIALGEGRTLESYRATTPMVAEGVPTTRAACALAERLGVEMPITQQMRRVLFEGLAPQLALAELMQRPPKAENGVERGKVT